MSIHGVFGGRHAVAKRPIAYRIFKLESMTDIYGVTIVLSNNKISIILFSSTGFHSIEGIIFNTGGLYTMSPAIQDSST